MEKKLRLWEAAALVALSFALCAGTWAQARQNSLSSKLVRLHVIAVSDDGLEQAVKLHVRDAVLEYLDARLTEAESANDARSIILADMEGIADAAAAAAGGREITVTMGREHYPTREYRGFTLPAGSYDSLRVVLGEGRGQNWWCVIFPPLCLSAAEGEKLQSVMSSDDYALITDEDGYVLRFRTVELWGELVNMIENIIK